jgi:hypothetical protein
MDVSQSRADEEDVSGLVLEADEMDADQQFEDSENQEELVKQRRWRLEQVRVNFDVILNLIFCAELTGNYYLIYNILIKNDRKITI